jgi:hypothetical protein
LPKGIEIPGHLYRLLKKNFIIKKGALLLPDSNGDVFLPWSISGFDKTTERRMRIDKAIIKNIMQDHEGKIITLSGKNLDQLRDCFSSREFALIDSMLICPFVFNDTILAVLIFSESIYLNAPEEILNLIMTVISETANPLLYEVRDKFLAKLDTKPIPSNLSVTSLIRKLISSSNGSGESPKVICIDISNVITAIQDVINDMDSFRLKADIFQILTAMIGTSGYVFSGKGNNIIIISTQNKIPDEELLLHQISTSLKDIFEEMSQPAEIEHSVRCYPEDGDNAEQLLGHCI